MIYSIYHFFKDLVDKKKYFRNIEKLEEFPFNRSMLSCFNKGRFPDLAIRLNSENILFTGGELIDLKDSKKYEVSSFNSTIPTGQKKIEKIIEGAKNKIKQQMEKAGNDILSLPDRNVYYLIRGKHNNDIKVVLIHGSFFETIKPDILISQSFKQVLEDFLEKENTKQPDENIKSNLVSLFSEQKNFSKVRDVNNASVKLRFRIMSEAKKEGNILNKEQYPKIKDNTLNFITPYHNSEEKGKILKCFQIAFNFNTDEIDNFSLKHHLDGNFMVFQIKI